MEGIVTEALDEARAIRGTYRVFGTWPGWQSRAGGQGPRPDPTASPMHPLPGSQSPPIPSSTELLQGFLCPWHSRLLLSTVTFCQASLPPGHSSVSGTALGAELSTGTTVTPPSP